MEVLLSSNRDNYSKICHIWQKNFRLHYCGFFLRVITGKVRKTDEEFLKYDNRFIVINFEKL
jgi:hypothetical protein